MGILTTIMGVKSYLNTDGSWLNPEQGPIMFSVYAFSSFYLALFFIWAIVEYTKLRLYLSDTHIESIGVLKRTEIAINKVIRVTWRNSPIGGSIVLCTPDCRIAIAFSHFTEEQRKEMVNYFHEKFTTQIQEEWDRFYGLFSKQHEPRPELSKTILVFSSLLLFAFVPVFLYFWRIVQGTSYLVISIICLIAALLFLVLSFNKKKHKTET
jgi:hypothetical protein